MFWSIAAAVLFAAALITFSPLMRAKSLWKPLALALVFLLPAGALWMYQEFGTPGAIDLVPPKQRSASANPAASDAHSSESQEMDAMIAGLQARLEQNPEDLNGWMLLARTLKATQRFPQAVQALEMADRIAPGNPQIQVDLVETQIFMTPDGRITDEMTATLKQALEVQPDLQKALWLMGIASSQGGDNAKAISYWETLLTHLEPGSPVANSVQSQIDNARATIGTGAAEVVEEAVVAEDDGSWSGTRVSVIADPSGNSKLPMGGVLYVMIRSPGPAMGPPLGVRRIIDPQLPLEVTITDQDSMMAERLISSESEVQLQARISRTGSPAATTGDWQSAQVTIDLSSTKALELVIDQRVE